MPKSQTHNEIVLRPPPGTRFTIFGSDVHLEFQRGREREIVTWLRNWIDFYIEPEARIHEQNQPTVQPVIQPAVQPAVQPVVQAPIYETRTNPAMVQPQPHQQQAPIWPVCIKCGQVYNSVINTRCMKEGFCSDKEEKPAEASKPAESSKPAEDSKPENSTINLDEILTRIKSKQKLPIDMSQVRKIADAEFEKLEKSAEQTNSTINEVINTEGNENHG